MSQIHRFRDKVAIYIGTGETVYLSPATAKRIAKALNACARDIAARERFGDTQFKTVTNNHDLPS